MAEWFYHELSRQHGFSRDIISDQNSLFTSRFGMELMKWLQLRLVLSNAFYARTDGYSDRALETIEDLLRCLANKAKQDRESHLPGLKFAYNSCKNKRTIQTPLATPYDEHFFFSWNVDIR